VKTNAARLLDELKIAYELREYEVDLEDLSAESVARKISMGLEQVFKTLVVRGERTGICMAVVPASAELNFKALAKVTGDRTMEMVPVKDIQPLTGYIRGGVTALACRQKYPVFIDETAILFDKISVSAGVRGTQMVLHPEDYIRAAGAVPGEIARS
jgi:Cys-tRNA(Pro)/Cys-tRNA(Cys) deacylase